ncbi:hypothetical protein CEXT_770071 [Caerostris extrusa]|uniref:Uncharacterized protein n=1 Tax=Caerostris extrusa TaxID=172846 RepID=A0AAV4Y4V9_CAEEX|nr:hypothetical protein CEXT_770071 [Caerostris extrusa]
MLSAKPLWSFELKYQWFECSTRYLQNPSGHSSPNISGLNAQPATKLLWSFEPSLVRILNMLSSMSSNHPRQISVV